MPDQTQVPLTPGLTVSPISAEDHLTWLADHSASFLQTPAWGKVKADWRNESLGWFRGQTLVSAALVLYRPIPKLKWSLAYLPDGPSLPTLNPELPVDSWATPLVDYLKTKKVFSIKMGPPVISRQWNAATIKSAIANGNVSKLGDVPADSHSAQAQELVEQLRASGWQQESSKADGFGDVQPRFVFQLGLENKSLDELFDGFSQEWRRNIRKAEKSDVAVKEGTFDDLKDFHTVYVETAQRDHFTPRPLSYFERMWQAMADEDPARLRLFLAKRGDEVLAATTLVTVNGHAWYSYGASTTASRDLRPSNAIQWAMIKAAHEAGSHTYDLRGIGDSLDPSDPLFGLIRFKLGTNGRASEYIGEFDFPLNALLHRAVTAYLARR